jgi:gluconate 5-dehydrogenase
MNLEKLFRLDGEVAVVTGAAGGLGKFMAEGLSEAGASVALLDVRKEPLSDTKSELLRKGFRVEAVECDITKEEQVKSAMGAIVAKMGSPGILVNNAGITKASPAVDFDLSDWKKVLDVNLNGMFLCSREASKLMTKKRRGKIINISSVYGIMADVSPELAYYTSKAGVVGLTRGLALEFARYGINVNAIAPGFFPSEMTRPFIEDLDALSYTLARIPTRKLQPPYELKGAVVFLCSRASDGITGQVIPVDSGWSIW